jgi:acetate kinase
VELSILVLNAGSSSLKFSLFDRQVRQVLAWGQLDRGAGGHFQEEGAAPVEVQGASTQGRAAVEPILGFLSRTRAASSGIEAVGHRVVHGGEAFHHSVPIDASARAEIARLKALAPLHNGPALEAIEAAQDLLPKVLQVAVFDTAFFAGLPRRAHVYALPYEWYAEWGVRRFGFHGINHAYCAARAAELLREDGLRLVTCHLGNGCSAAAVRGGAAVATTMGFTPLEGLMMGTRPGSVDPGILLFLQREKGLTAAQLDQALNHGSGLLGISGLSPDYRQVEEAARQGNERARLALEMYADRITATAAALVASLGGLDALAFTAGVGENAAPLRAQVCRDLAFLGLELDPERNAGCRPDAEVATTRSTARILVLRAREDLMIARETRRFMAERI